MSGLFGKAVDFYKSGVKATVSAGLDIAREHVLPKQEINEENLMSKEEATDFAGHSAVINSLAVSEDGETLFSAGKDQKIRMWHTRTGKSAGVVGDQESEVNSFIVVSRKELPVDCIMRLTRASRSTRLSWTHHQTCCTPATWPAASRSGTGGLQRTLSLKIPTCLSGRPSPSGRRHTAVTSAALL